MPQGFNELERAILDWIRSRDMAKGLAQQIELAAFQSREHTGAGVYVNLEVPSDTQRILNYTRPYSLAQRLTRRN